ncbi:hypothetical protein llap_20376 [Limosa lapponica baueri]|uniref:Claudin 10 n=1 Tax=Limosa lapponica baueri TaxID=1758121 RepID=A0A2I0T6C6_LIMLA|nr:hypothetical protein llap_20376 [Limosa lapponica baueri]
MAFRPSLNTSGYQRQLHAMPFHLYAFLYKKSVWPALVEAYNSYSYFIDYCVSLADGLQKHVANVKKSTCMPRDVDKWQMKAFLADPNQIGGMSRQAQDPRQGYIQACRGLMISAVCLGFFGAIFGLVGMKCTKVGGSDQTKAKIACLAGLIFILSGLCSMTSCSLYANRITSEFFDPSFVAQNLTSIIVIIVTDK